jgi:hypothetical protein
MARSGISAENTEARSSPCDAERLARANIEKGCGHPLGDKEWVKQRGRLIEFILILTRWDAERRTTDSERVRR